MGRAQTASVSEYKNQLSTKLCLEILQIAFDQFKNIMTLLLLEQSNLCHLPPEVLVRLVETLIAVANPGVVLNFMLVNKKMYSMVQSLNDLWQEKCQRQGWYQHKECFPESCMNDNWFRYYCIRMQARWRIRRLLKLYIPFLDIRSRSALQPGAQPGQIAFNEQRLGIELPFELWELYRFRNGQQHELGAMFSDEQRLLPLHETICQTRQVVVNGQYQDVKVVQLTDSGNGGKRYCVVDYKGNVYVCSGFRTILMWDSIGSFIQRLLR
eukprot:TRINITY_DN724_c0_g4_i2.p2 TRINITY_DN724_c0_g4~~TRINITY_DN724_c0_g4_i2.p2  ORF type:complete len:268 (-),score=8.69 TRINITY_DN724_c0_g4_i2:1138-1941(-)